MALDYVGTACLSRLAWLVVSLCLVLSGIGVDQSNKEHDAALQQESRFAAAVAPGCTVIAPPRSIPSSTGSSGSPGAEGRLEILLRLDTQPPRVACNYTHSLPSTSLTLAEAEKWNLGTTRPCWYDRSTLNVTLAPSVSLGREAEAEGSLGAVIFEAPDSAVWESRSA